MSRTVSFNGVSIARSAKYVPFFALYFVSMSLYISSINSSTLSVFDNHSSGIRIKSSTSLIECVGNTPLPISNICCAYNLDAVSPSPIRIFRINLNGLNLCQISLWFIHALITNACLPFSSHFIPVIIIIIRLFLYNLSNIISTVSLIITRDILRLFRYHIIIIVGCGFTHETEYNIVDNQWVIPYNPGLLKALRCHINVESVANVDCVKYIFKYVQKGTDRASVIIKDLDNEPVNEIGIREDCRYICPYEACGNIYGFKKWNNYPKVERLPVIVDGNEFVYWEESEPWRVVSNLEKSKRTKISEFFRNNKLEKTDPLSDKERTINGIIGPHGYELLYYEYPEYYTWVNTKNEWKRRVKPSKEPAIGRIHLTNVNERKRHFMRLLLLHVKGPTCWNDLKTVTNSSGVTATYDTYIEACEALGLLQNDQEHIRCLSEAVFFQSARALRTLFVTLLRWSQPVHPVELWDLFKDEMCHDIRRQLDEDEYSQQT